MVICWSARPRLVPASAPGVTSSCWGVDRPARLPRAGLGGWEGLTRCCRCPRACLRDGTEVPKRSVRTTPTAAITNSHRTARNAIVMTVRVSAFMGSCLWWPLLVGGRRSRPGRAASSAGSVMPAMVQSCGCGVSVDTVPAEDEGRAAQGDARAIGQGHAPDRLAVDERAVGGAEVDEDDLPVLDAQLGVVAGDARVDQAQVTVGAPAQNGQRRRELVRPLRVAVGARFWPGDEQPRRSGEAAGRMREVAGGPANLAVLDGRAADDAGPDPERAPGQVA